MLPVADFSVKNNYNQPTYFFCENENVRFTNASWNDTITGVSWTFSNSPLIPANTSNTLINKFYQPGWVTVTLAATGNNTGTTTLTDTVALYIADTTPTNGNGYYQEFNNGGDLYKWPMFNYFNNSFKWQLVDVGYYDNACVAYIGYDYRTFPANATGTPQGDYDDLFTPVFDLTGYSGNCYLNFMSSGATITSNPRAMTDTLEIDYSTDLANTWHVLDKLVKDSLDNKGTINTPYWPSGMSDWVPQAIPIPVSVQKRQTIFRFRYHPGADSNGISSGNNFYLDRFNINSVPESVAVIDNMNDCVSLQPNPTHTSAYVIIKDKAGIQSATVVVTDITGKVVYETTSNKYGSAARIEIPESMITSKGLYLVHIITDQLNQTEKLVVY